MIREYVNDLASQMGIQLSQITVVEGRYAGCLDVYLLHLSVDDQVVDVLIHLPELENLKSGISSNRLEDKIRSALSRLQLLLEP